MQLQEAIQNPRRQRAMAVRTQVEKGIRGFFEGRNFLEVQTPILVECPGMEPYINTFKLEEGYLQTSPEFAMKKLLVGGLPKIFQLAPVFRKEPSSNTHKPEFTMLEWYRAPGTYEETMKDTEDLLMTLGENSKASHLLKAPFPRYSTSELFLKYTGVDPLAEGAHESLQACCSQHHLSSDSGLSFDDAYYLVWLNLIEPHLPEQPCFVKDYPVSQAALAKTEQNAKGQTYAKRFELYCNGLELANAFEELTDPMEQRLRFEKDEKIFRQNFGRSPGNYEPFLAALAQGLPPSSGVALGVDRLVMFLANESEIAFTRWLP